MAPPESERARGDPERTTGEVLYAGVTRIFSVVIAGLGLAMIVVTLARGEGPTAVGILIGLLFTAIGAARLYIALRPRN